MDESIYVDSNGNGVPDVFENRKPITDILNEDYQGNAAGYSLEVAFPRRVPKKGELYLVADEVYRAVSDCRYSSFLIVVRVISGRPKIIDG